MGGRVARDCSESTRNGGFWGVMVVDLEKISGREVTEFQQHSIGPLVHSGLVGVAFVGSKQIGRLAFLTVFSSSSSAATAGGHHRNVHLVRHFPLLPSSSSPISETPCSPSCSGKHGGAEEDQVDVRLEDEARRARVGGPGVQPAQGHGGRQLHQIRYTTSDRIFGDYPLLSRKVRMPSPRTLLTVCRHKTPITLDWSRNPIFGDGKPSQVI
uniref:Uncharacterized protein n=1 Tax=Oryza rufipogon TaxID=4529 RepID=A0A0E0QFV8_ORYRU